MSLILEALRRSEAERRLGRAPDLLSPMPTAARRGRRAWLRGGAIALALAAVGAGAWWLGQRSAAPPPAGGDTGTAITEAATPAAPTAPSPTATPSPTPPVTTGSAPSARPLPPANAGPVRPAAPVPTAPAPPASAAGEPAPAGPASASDLAELRKRLAPAAAEAPAPTAAVPQTASEADAIPPLSSLSAEVRAALPPLRLTMHVYNESPERRFVILDGRRLTEGVALGANLAIDEIRRDGVVLDLDGRRVLLPRP